MNSTRLPSLPDVSYSTLASEALYRAFNRSVIIGLLAARKEWDLINWENVEAQ